MKMRAILPGLVAVALLSGCQNMDSNGLLSSGAEAFQAYTLSDAQVKTLSDEACKEMDSKATIACGQPVRTASEYHRRRAGR